jgi:hypothetical protein
MFKLPMKWVIVYQKIYGVGFECLIWQQVAHGSAQDNVSATEFLFWINLFKI